MLSSRRRCSDYSTRAIEAVAHQLHNRKGAKRLAAALNQLREPTPPTRSALEDAFLDLCARHAIQRPLINRRVGRFEVDFLWSAQRVIAETDGYVYQGARSSFEVDRWRDLELEAAG